MNRSVLLAVAIFTGAATSGFAIPPVPYEDGRPQASLRLEAKDQGVVLRHRAGPNQCDYLGARDVWVWQHADTYYMHYDGSGPKGWLACLAVSKDLEHWIPQGAILDFGATNSNDSAAASYGTTYFDGQRWHMFYLGTPHVTPAPDCIPSFPYLTMKAESAAPGGPWVKRYSVTPFRVKNNTYYAGCASPGYIIKQGSEYLMFFSASTDVPISRTISLARTRDLDGPWTLATEPLLPPTEQIEMGSGAQGGGAGLQQLQMVQAHHRSPIGSLTWQATGDFLRWPGRRPHPSRSQEPHESGHRSGLAGPAVNRSCLGE